MNRAHIRSITEEDFAALAWAANVALNAGDAVLANRLDCMARKANAALAYQANAHLAIWAKAPRALRWTEVPSTLNIRG